MNKSNEPGKMNNMATIENEYLKVSILPKGAELNNIYHKITGLEYLWNADPAFWNKKSPVLFPIVGTLKGDTYYHGGKSYQMGRHGFAREMEFDLTDHDLISARFTLKSDPITREKYPFDFILHIIYSLEANQLNVRYVVHNTGSDTMYFSIGGHPAFRVPLVSAHRYHDYYLEFSQEENADRWPISGEGLIEKTPLPVLINTNRLPLSRELFAKDALVFKHLQSDSVRLLSDVSGHGISFLFKGFPYLGVWAFKGADFVCIEPWCGIADSVDSNQQLTDKEGIEPLAAGQTFERTWSVTAF